MYIYVIFFQYILSQGGPLLFLGGRLNHTVLDKTLVTILLHVEKNLKQRCCIPLCKLQFTRYQCIYIYLHANSWSHLFIPNATPSCC